MVPADSGGITRVPPYSGCRAGDNGFGYGAITLCGAAFQAASPRLRPSASAVLQPRGRPKTAPVWAHPLSLATTRGIIGLFSLPAGTKMFQFPAFASPRHRGDTGKAGGLSHSETRGSKATCAYPRIIAACHVLHRLREPRHPPCALELLPRHPHKRREAVNLRSCLCRLSKIDRRVKRRGGKGRRPGRFR